MARGSESEHWAGKRAFFFFFVFLLFVLFLNNTRYIFFFLMFFRWARLRPKGMCCPRPPGLPGPRDLQAGQAQQKSTSEVSEPHPSFTLHGARRHFLVTLEPPRIRRRAGGGLGGGVILYPLLGVRHAEQCRRIYCYHQHSPESKPEKPASDAPDSRFQANPTPRNPIKNPQNPKPKPWALNLNPKNLKPKP